MNIHDNSGTLFSLRDIKNRIGSRVLSGSAEPDGDHVRNPEFKELVLANATKPAAVLIPLIEREAGTHVVLTKRTEKLKSHSGQISFPGGKIDPEDKSPEHAALREANEEIGLAYEAVEVIGRMPDYFSGSGYKIAPIFGAVHPDTRFEANPDEVDYIFEVPLEFLMTPGNHLEASRIFKGNRRYYLEMPYKEHYIWGVTAGIIRVIYDRLYA